MSEHRPPRVLLLITSTAGGVGVHAYYLARYLPARGFDLAVGYGAGYPMDADMERLGLPVIHFSISRRISPFTNLRALWQVYRYLARNPVDILLMECSIAGFIGRVAGWFAGVPTRIYCLQLYASHVWQSRAKQWVYRIIERTLDAFTTHYVAPSRAMVRFGVKHRILRESDVTVIHNAITLSDKIIPDAPKRIQRRAELGLRPNGLVIGTLSRFEPQKGIPFLLRAAAAVHEKQPDVQFMIGGDGPLRAELEKLANSLGLSNVVHFVGWRIDVPAVLSCMDIFCMASLWESFGIVFAEAMAMGVPVVSTTVDGIPEVVAHGETGLLVPPADVPALAEALLTLVRDETLRAQMGSAGRKRAHELFDVECMIDGFADLLRRFSAGSFSESNACGKPTAANCRKQ